MKKRRILVCITVVVAFLLLSCAVGFGVERHRENAFWSDAVPLELLPKSELPDGAAQLSETVGIRLETQADFHKTILQNATPDAVYKAGAGTKPDGEFVIFTDSFVGDVLQIHVVCIQSVEAQPNIWTVGVEFTRADGEPLGVGYTYSLAADGLLWNENAGKNAALLYFGGDTWVQKPLTPGGALTLERLPRCVPAQTADPREACRVVQVWGTLYMTDESAGSKLLRLQISAEHRFSEAKSARFTVAWPSEM